MCEGRRRLASGVGPAQATAQMSKGKASPAEPIAFDTTFGGRVYIESTTEATGKLRNSLSLSLFRGESFVDGPVARHRPVVPPPTAVPHHPTVSLDDDDDDDICSRRLPQSTGAHFFSRGQRCRVASRPLPVVSM